MKITIERGTDRAPYLILAAETQAEGYQIEEIRSTLHVFEIKNDLSDGNVLEILLKR